MNVPETAAHGNLDLARRLDQACNHFEDAWKAGRPRIEDHLEGWEGAERSALLRELVLLDIDYRRRAGEACQAGDYLGRFPELASDWLADALGRASGAGGGSTLPHATPWQPPTLPVGERFGDYELVREIARGGMGVVYEARQTALDRPVAVKMILGGGHADDEDHRRFLVEAGAIAKVRHPNIVQIYDFGTHEGRPYFSMELCPTSLADRLDGDPMPAAAAAKLMEPIARAVHAAHQARVLHRDLKPANVLLAEDGTPRVTDFGLAKRLEDAGHSLASGTFVGTPSYAAPEQALGRRDVGPPADVYSLGAILYECLTGRPPFKAASPVETLAAVVADDAVPVRQLNRSIPLDLETICLKCLRKEPGRRYASAAALAEDLRRFLEGRPIEARPVGQSERAFRWCRRNPAVAGLVAAVFVALAVGAAVSSAYAVKAGHEAVRADAKAEEAGEREREAVREKVRADEQLGRAELLVYASKLARAQSAFAGDDGDLALQYLTECKASLRGWEYRLLWTRFNARQTLRGHTQGLNSVAFSPDGRRIVTGSWDKTAKVWDAGTGREIFTLAGHTNTVYRVAYSPEGKRIVTGSWDKTAKVWDATTGRLLFTLAGHTNPICGVAYSPDGKRILTASGPISQTNTSAPQQGEAKVWDAETGAEIFTFASHPWGLLGVAYSPDGGRIVTGSWNKAKVWDARTGREILSLGGEIGPVAYSPDGKRLLTGGTIAKLWDAETGREIFSLKWQRREALQPNQVMSVAYSPDGRHLVTGGYDKTVKVWDAESGREVFSLRGHSAAVMGVAYSPDGRRIVTGSWDTTAKMWDAERGQEPLTFGERTNGLPSVAFSPDGERIVTYRSSEPAKVWDAKTCRELFTFDGRAGRLQAGGVAYSPDGRRIVLGICTYDPLGKELHAEAKVFDSDTGKQILSLESHAGGFGRVAYSPDGRRIVTGSRDKPARVWDAETGRLIFALEGHKTSSITVVAYSPDGTRIAAGHTGARIATSSGGFDYTSKVWDAGTGRVLLTLRGHTGPVYCVAYSPDGRRIVTGSWDKTAKMWDAETGREILSLKGHTGYVVCVAFSPDGTRIATAGRDMTVRMWDAATGQEVLTLRGHDKYVECIAFSPDGGRLLTGDWDNQFKLWDTGNASKELQNVYPLPDAAERRRYHTQQADRAEREGKWFAVAFHVGRLLLDTPQDAGLARRRGGFAQHAFLKGDEMRSKGDFAGAMAVLREGQAIAPEDADLNHYLALMLVVCPDPKLRDAKLAVTLARKAIGTTPANSSWIRLRTLGLAQHFAGDDREAVKALNMSLKLRNGRGNAFDYFPLAAIHQRLGNKEEARKWYDRGVAWVRENRRFHADAELAVLRADAEAALGIGKQPKPPRVMPRADE